MQVFGRPCVHTVIFTHHLGCLCSMHKAPATDSRHARQDLEARRKRQRFAPFPPLRVIILMIYDNELLLQMVLNHVRAALGRRGNSLRNTIVLSRCHNISNILDYAAEISPSGNTAGPVLPLPSHLFSAWTSATIKQCQHVYCKYEHGSWKGTSQPLLFLYIM